MSRCYPFPPPGYVKNATATIEFPEKKEKRKHKDKKKKSKKHPAKGGDSTQQEYSREATLDTVAAIDGTQSVSSLAAHHEDANGRLQASSSRKEEVSIATEEVVSSDVLVNQKRGQAVSGSGKQVVSSADEFILRVERDTNKEKQPTINARVKEVPNGGSTDREKWHASSARAKGGRPNGGITIDPQVAEQRLHPRDEILPSSKRPRLQEDNTKGPSNARSEMPEQRLQSDVARNKVGSIGVVADRKCKSMEQDNRFTINGNRPEQRTQKGGPGYAAPNNNTTASFERSQAQRPAINGVHGFPAGHEVLSNGRDAKKSQAGSKYSSVVLSHGARPVEASGTTVGPAKSGRPDYTLQSDDPRYGMLSNGLQATNSERRLHISKAENPSMEACSSNGVPAATQCTRIQTDLEAGKLSLGVPPTNHNKSQASGVARIQADLEAGKLSHGVPPTKHRKSRASNTTTSQALSTSQVPALNCEHRTVQVANAKRDALSNGVEAKKEVLMNGGQGVTQIEKPPVNIVNEKMLPNRVHTASEGQVSHRQPTLKADSHGEKVRPHGIQKNKPKDNRGKQLLQAENIANGLPVAFSAEETKLYSSKINGSDCNGGTGKDVALACKVSSESDYMRSRQYLAQYMPRIHDVIFTVDDEDWLFDSVHKAPPKSNEMVEGQAPPVCVEARLLRSVGIHALPYVVAD